MSNLDSRLDGLALPQGWTLHFESEVGSTQDLARDAARRDAGSRHVFLTDFQSTGRGRAGRTWSAPPGTGLLFTLLLREPFLKLQEHTVCASVSVCEAVESGTPLMPAIKWPNDLLIDDRKVCGILAEASDASPGYVAVGVGLNVTWGANRPDDVPPWATALDEHLTVSVGRRELLRQIVQKLDEWLTALIQPSGAAELRAAWDRRLWRRGELVNVTLHDRRIRGRLLGTNAQGELVVESENGDEIAVLSGELELPDRPPHRNYAN